MLYKLLHIHVMLHQENIMIIVIEEEMLKTLSMLLEPKLMDQEVNIKLTLKDHSPLLLVSTLLDQVN
jgi:hypothetical protein